MRSRDGDHYRSLAICSLIFFSSLSLSASEYFISYRYVVKDMTLFNESLQVSRAMKQCSGTPTNYIDLTHNDSKDLNKIIKKNYQEFVEYIHRLGLNLEHNTLTSNAQYSSKTIMLLKTTCFKVEFNDYFVRITALK